MSRPLLQVEGLRCGYPGKTVLHNIDFKINKREIVSIIGPNGSGKTTLLRAISRILAPINGNIILRGVHIEKMGRKELAQKVAVVGQTHESVALSVEDYVLLGRLPFHRPFQFLETAHDRELVERCLELTGIINKKSADMRELSGGQRQLAAIAQALAQEPELLLLDEPTSHLDISHQVRILDLISSLNRDMGLTVLMVMHDLNLASDYSHRLLLINNGAVYAKGKPEQVLTGPTIKTVYNTAVNIEKNPFTGKPYVFLVTNKLDGFVKSPRFTG